MAWLTDIHSLTSKQQPHPQKPLNVSKKEEDSSLSWEWCEGRLFAYELVLKFLLTNHLYFSLSSKVGEDQNNKQGRGSKKVSTSVNEPRGGLRGRKSFESLENLKGRRKSMTRSLTLSTVSVTELSAHPEIRDNNLKERIQGDSLITMAKHEELKEELCLCESVPMLQLTRLPEVSVEDLLDDQAKLVAAEQKLRRWLCDQDMCTFKCVLRQMLVQTVECLHKDRWELRRMAQQVCEYCEGRII